ncbi:MAG: acyl-CoA desaturase [Gammaproteobacteria bacterium]|nr:MAG: acyl-CoA desaturase [Gammaproteobacteria bacterium]
MAHGLWNLSPLALVAITLVLTHITIVSVTVYLHRYSAHRSLELHPVLKHFFRFWLWMTTGMTTLEWTAIHRKHHATCETEDDPHSPQIKGLGTILWSGAEEYRKEAKNEETLERYGKGCPNDWVERNVYSRFPIGGIGTLLVIDVALFGAIGLTIWAVQMIWIPFFAAGVINGIGHYWGYRNYECPDAATNISPWGILIGGEELHNNHHTYPNSAKLSQKWFEFDIGWFWIRLFETLGLAKVRSTGPVALKEPGKQTLDLDTAWAVVNNRFQVMARYAESVVKPLVKQELDSSSSRAARKASTALTRDECLVDEQSQTRIDELTSASPNLATIYEFRQRLQGIWAKRGGNAEELLAALKQWCLDAEETGIQALKDFVAELRTYTMPKTATA